MEKLTQDDLVKTEAALINFRIHFIKWIIAAISWAQVAVDPAIRKILAVFTQKRAFINQFATKATAMALALTGVGNRLFNVLRTKRS
jgi:hypothetical protein